MSQNFGKRSYSLKGGHARLGKTQEKDLSRVYVARPIGYCQKCGTELPKHQLVELWADHLDEPIRVCKNCL